MQNANQNDTARILEVLAELKKLTLANSLPFVPAKLAREILDLKRTKMHELAKAGRLKVKTLDFKKVYYTRDSIVKLIMGEDSPADQNHQKAA
jgi:hypothetical protein